MKHVYTKKAPTPGAYSQGVLVDPGTHKLLFLAGQTGNDKSRKGEPVVEGGVGPQTTQCLKNIATILDSLDHTHPMFLVSVDVFLKDSGNVQARQDDWYKYNEAYKSFFKEYGITKLPARMQVWVADVPWATEDTLVEVRAVAAIPW